MVAHDILVNFKGVVVDFQSLDFRTLETTNQADISLSEKVELPKRKSKIRESIRLTRKRPNYADKVWKNISCLAAEVDELDSTENKTQTVQKKRPKRKSFCSLQ